MQHGWNAIAIQKMTISPTTLDCKILKVGTPVVRTRNDNYFLPSRSIKRSVRSSITARIYDGAYSIHSPRLNTSRPLRSTLAAISSAAEALDTASDTAIEQENALNAGGDPESPPYVALHVHSHFSLLDGASQVSSFLIYGKANRNKEYVYVNVYM